MYACMHVHYAYTHYMYTWRRWHLMWYGAHAHTHTHILSDFLCHSANFLFRNVCGSILCTKPPTPHLFQWHWCQLSDTVCTMHLALPTFVEIQNSPEPQGSAKGMMEQRCPTNKEVVVPPGMVSRSRWHLKIPSGTSCG